MGYFRMKLNAVQSFSFFLKRGNFYRRGTGDDIKLVRYRDNGIGVRHPNLGINRNLLQQFIVVIDCAKFGTPVLAVLRRHYASPHLIGNQLGSVTNSEYMCIFVPGEVYFGGARIPYRTRTSGQDNALYQRSNLRYFIKGMDFTIHIEFPNPARNKLSVLRAKIKDENLVGHAQK